MPVPPLPPSERAAHRAATPPTITTRRHGAGAAVRRLAGAAGLALLGAGLGGCASPPAPLPTVAQVDLGRYLGTWHEIAHLPNRFQAQCVADTQAVYAADGERLSVRNRCRRADGGFDEALGVAEVVPDSGNAKLRVSFFRPFWGDYWVLALDPDYRWVLVGEPGRRFGWVLARDPALPPEDLARALDEARARGYEPGRFVRTPHTGAATGTGTGTVKGP